MNKFGTVLLSSRMGDILIPEDHMIHGVINQRSGQVYLTYEADDLSPIMARGIIGVREGESAEFEFDMQFIGVAFFYGEITAFYAQGNW